MEFNRYEYDFSISIYCIVYPTWSRINIWLKAWFMVHLFPNNYNFNPCIPVQEITAAYIFCTPWPKILKQKKTKINILKGLFLKYIPEFSVFTRISRLDCRNELKRNKNIFLFKCKNKKILERLFEIIFFYFFLFEHILFANY